MLKSCIAHMRLPFFWFLLPVFLFSLHGLEKYSAGKAWLIFFVIHFLLYPASHAFNSYFDRDQASIALLKRPPPVVGSLLWISLALDAIAIAVGWIFVDTSFVLIVLVYGLASKAYSMPPIRLKRYPWVSWFIVSLFQGPGVYLMVQVALSGDLVLSTAHFVSALTAFGLIGAAYPLTQIYQHAEDGKRGDLTLSRHLGIEGTFRFSAVFFGLTGVGLLAHGFSGVGLLLLCLPAAAFIRWMTQSLADASHANFERTMRFNWFSSTVLNAFFWLNLL